MKKNRKAIAQSIADYITRSTMLSLKKVVISKVETGVLLRQLQQGVSIGLPHSRPMPSIEERCHELRIRDADKNWRIIYRIDDDAILIVDVFNKSTRAMPKKVIDICKKRLSKYDAD